MKKVKNYKLPRKNIHKIKVSFFAYDSNLDILEIRTEGKTHHSINIDDFIIIDLSEKNKVVGLEFMNISKLYNIPKIFFKNFKSSKILVHSIPQEKRIFITVNLISVINHKENITRYLTTPPINSITNKPLCITSP